MTQPENMMGRLLDENYTTEEVATAIGRKAVHWCRIRHKFIAKYELKAVKVGRRFYYEKTRVNKMIEQILATGEN